MIYAALYLAASLAVVQGGGSPPGQGISTALTGVAPTYDDNYQERQKFARLQAFERRVDVVREKDGGSLTPAHRSVLRAEMESLAQRLNMRLVFTDGHVQAGR